MHRPAILLDENLLWCRHKPPEEYEAFGQKVVESLKRRGKITGDVFFIGQRLIVKEGKPAVPVEQEMKAEKVERQGWFTEKEGYPRAFVAVAKGCADDVYETARKAREPVTSRFIRAEFIECVRERMPGVTAAYQTAAAFPQRGVRDFDIRVWAEKNSVLILSADYGADLQPGKATERILIRRPPCSGDMAKDADVLADVILRRLAEVKELLRGFTWPPEPG